MKIKQLIKVLGDYNTANDFNVRGISCNSKDVSDNFVFVAIKGTKQDGSRFIEEAIGKGAKAVVVHGSCKVFDGIDQRKTNFICVKDTRKALAELAAEFYGNPSLRMKVIGVTGTNGKTTVTYLIESLLRQERSQAGVVGTINYRFKDKIISSKNTTPGPVELQSMLADMVKDRVRYCVMEVSSHALDQDRIACIDFSSAIFTNLTQDHLDYHGTLENYFKSKTKLFKSIKSNSAAIINNDDKYGTRLKKLTKARIVTYGIDSKSEVSAKDIRFAVSNTSFLLVCPKGEILLNSPLIGRHNVYNVLAAAGWALQEGIGLPQIKSSIERFSCVPGRLERIETKRDFSVFVDYAHTQDALKNVISSLRRLSNARIITVFGCGGERDKTKRPKMGKVVTDLADYAVITSDNPRSENPLDIIEDIKRGIKKTNYRIIKERRGAIKEALALAKSGDIVLIAGKGHENYQISKGKTLHFDDREVIRECLSSMKY